MKELNSQTRILLERAKRADGPPPCARDQVSRALVGAVVTSTVTLGTTAAEATLCSVTSNTGLLSLLPIGKFGAVLATSIGLAGGGVFVAVANQHDARTGTPAPRATVSVALPIRPEAVTLPTPIQATSSAATIAPSAPRQVGSVVVPTPQTKSKVADETRLLAQVQQALRVGDGQQALVLLGRYRREFGQGALVEEASAAEVFALCAVGDTQRAKHTAKEFLRHFSGSPLAPRVEASCGAREATDEAGQVDFVDGTHRLSSPITEP